jgi:S1-C subfamily serine protease
MRRALRITFCLLFVASPAGALTVQEALLRSKPAVALVMSEVTATVTLRCGAVEQAVKIAPRRETGTAWFVASNGRLLTNAHVVSWSQRPVEALQNDALEAAVRETCLPTLLSQRGVAAGQRPDLERDLIRQLVAPQRLTARIDVEPSVTVVLSNGVRFPARVLKYSPPVSAATMSGQDLALLHIDAADMPSLPLADRGTGKIGDTLYILGFPSIVGQHELLSTSAQFEASVTKGSVSGFKEDVNGQPVVQTDAEAVWGNSGGPAVDAAGRVIGMLTLVMMESGERHATVQGFNFVIPVAGIRDFLQGTDTVINGPSAFNTIWNSALRAFFAGRHAKAARSLRDTDRLLPQLPDVRRITAANEESIKHPPRRRFPFAAVAFAGTSVGVAAIGAAGLLRWRRNRYRITPAEVARLIAASPDPPIILDARNDETYERSPVRLPGAVHVTVKSLDDETSTRDLDRSRAVVAYCT